jgi:DNA/RNA-binding protein KIN17
MAKKLADGKYYKQKAVVLDVHDKYIASLEMIKSGDLLKIDQAELETVIPAIGSAVVVVNGTGRGELAELTDMDVDKFCVSVRLEADGRVLERVDYEDVCKVDR